MDIITRNDIQMLMQTRGAFCLSLFLSTERIVDTAQNPLRFKNLLREAEDRLVAHGLRSPSTTHGKLLLKPLYDMLADALFWEHQSDGLALFRSSDAFFLYRLPTRFEEQVIVGNRFHLKPLLPFLTGDGFFYLLALSQNEIKLLEGTCFHVDEIELPATVHEYLMAALKSDDPQKQLQFHTMAPKGTYRGRAAIFHGHSDQGLHTKERLGHSLQQIDKGLQEIFKGRQAPLVLAGVEELISLYRQVTTFPHVLQEGVTGNPEALTAQELHQRAWAIVEPHFQQEQQDAAARYQLAVQTKQASHLALNEIKEIVPVASQGRIACLFLARNRQQWGCFDPVTQTVTLHQSMEPGDEDLFDFAALETLLHNGTVYVGEPEQVPDQSQIAALLRY
jgi:hypothetical protein